MSLEKKTSVSTLARNNNSQIGMGPGSVNSNQNNNKDKDKDKGKKKRTGTACTHCRQRHIKCDGLGEPCTTCIQLGQPCVYSEAERKVVISVKYLDKLQKQISKLKKENANLRSHNKNSKGNGDNKLSASNNATNEEYSSDENDDDEVATVIPLETFNKCNSSSGESISVKHDDNLSNDESGKKQHQEVIPPFLEKYGRLINSRTGEKLYIGSSSITLFGLEIDRLISPELVANSPTDVKSETILEKEGNAYRIMLGKTHSRPGMDVNFTLPSYSYAMLLVDSFVSYNDGCFYFFNEGLVKENLRRIYNDDQNTGFKLDYGIESLNNSSHTDPTLETIWFCKLLLVFAVGEMYLGTANYLNGYKLNEKPKRKKQKLNSMEENNDHISENSPESNSFNPKRKNKRKSSATKLPGSGFFNQASELFTGLFASGSIDNCIREGGIEVLLLYAFYLQVADCTAASYFYFGIALRASLLLGLHVDIGKDSLNRFELEHRRRLWWTVYMYERMLASKAGLPLSLTDEDISTELPNDFDMSNPFPCCENYIFPEAEFISNCVKITQINANILRKLYTRQPSSNILPVVHEMVVALMKWKKELPNDINCDYSQKELTISRLVVNMMTEYFQGVNLAVRPLLFHFVLLNIKSAKPNNEKVLDLSKYSPIILVLLNSSFQASINTIRSLWALLPENMVAMFGYMDREYLYNATVTLILFNATFGVYDATNEHLDHALTLFTKMRNLGNHPATLRREQILRLISILDFKGSMQNLLKKHNDNLTPPTSSANTDKSFGHKMSVTPNVASVNSTNGSLQDTNIQHFTSLFNTVRPNEQHSYLSTTTSPPLNIPTQHSNFNLASLNQPSFFQQNSNNSSTTGLNRNTSFVDPLHSILDRSKPQQEINIGYFSPSLSTVFNQIEDIPEFDQLSTSHDIELWKDVTNQAAWLQNDMGDEFGNLLDHNTEDHQK